MAGIAHQLEVLQHIAAFSARAYGHELTAWRIGRFSATAACWKCRRPVSVHVGLLQPDIDGPALNAEWALRNVVNAVLKEPHERATGMIQRYLGKISGRCSTVSISTSKPAHTTAF